MRHIHMQMQRVFHLATILSTIVIDVGGMVLPMDHRSIRTMGYRNDKCREQIEEEKKDEITDDTPKTSSAELHGNKKRSSDDRGADEPIEQENNQDGDHQQLKAAAMLPAATTSAFQIQQQLQASLAAQQHFLEQAAAVQQQLTPTLNSLQLNNNCTASNELQPASTQHFGVTAPTTTGTPYNPAFASQPALGANTNSVGNPQQALSAVGISATPITVALAGAGTTTAAVTAAANVIAPSLLPTVAIPKTQHQLIATPTPTTTTTVQPKQQQLLIPQLTIPHYIPPTPPTWGAQFPALSVQDRPLVPPIYNGINPNYPGAQLLHAHPPIFCVHNFLSPAECDFLIHNANDAFVPAPVVGRGSGEVSPSRTSSTCYLAREDLPEYMRKITLLTGKPPEHCELPQVGRYYPSQQYLQHFDAFDLSNEDGIRFASNGGQRTITVLTYLNDVARGGATSFPNLNLEVQPRKGMALVFFPATLDGLLDKMALHAALPAVDVKYVSQVWVRQTNYDGTPSKRLVEPMVSGLQERWEEQQQQQQQLQVQQQQAQQQMLLGQLQLQQAQQQQQLQLQQHLQQAQQQQQQHLQQSNEQQQLHGLGRVSEL